MKKTGRIGIIARIAMLFLIIAAAAMMAGGLAGCAPNLTTYPPTAIDPSVVDGLQNLRLSPYMPSEKYEAALKGVIENSKRSISIYQDKLFPVFNEMYRKYQVKDYDGTNVLIAKARGYNAEWMNSYAELKNAYIKLSEANKEVSNPAIKDKTEQVVRSGKSFVKEAMQTFNVIRQFLDIAEGYDKARVEMNLGFLTEENKQRFNNLSLTLHQQGDELNKKGGELFRLGIELNNLLNGLDKKRGLI